MQLLFEAPDFSVVHDQPNQWLYVSWQGEHSPATTRTRCDQVLSYVRQTGSALILNDSSQDLDCWGELAGWVAHDFMRELAASGVLTIAWVLPENLRARTDSEAVVLMRRLANLTRPVLSTFADLESAHTWLQRQARPAPQ